ncbi:class I SAM-dependent methyltransferase [bacterium]|nr:class I SAM-dependent methyltransferase [bacterium]
MTTEEKEKKIEAKRKSRTTDWEAEEAKRSNFPYSRVAVIENIFDKNSQEVLLELEKTQNDFWNVARSTGNFLNMLIKATGKKNVVEIGTSNGYSGIWIANALKSTGGHLTTIEYYEKRIELAKENFKKCGLDDIITIKQGSALEVLQELVKEPDFKCDMLFIDANKREYIEDLKIIDSTLKIGSIITADNITSHADKVVPFVEALQKDDRYQMEILDLPAGLLVAYKIAE